MTVAIQTPSNRYSYAGSSLFVYAFQVLQAADLVVAVDGVVKTQGVDYTLTGVGAQAGGTVTYLSALTIGQIVTLYRSTALARSTDYQNNGDFLSATVNADFDRLWMALQEGRERHRAARRAGTRWRTPHGHACSECSRGIPARLRQPR
jgi:hypothetical protein